jgi:hypothetical protein
VVSLGNTLAQRMRDLPVLSIIGLGFLSAAAAIAFGIAACFVVIGVSLVLVEMVVAK